MLQRSERIKRDGKVVTSRQAPLTLTPSGRRYAEFSPLFRCRPMRKIAFVAGALFAGLVCPAPSEGQSSDPLPGDPQAFTETFIILCREAAPNLKLAIVGPLSLRADTAQGEADVHLDTVYSACQRDPAGCGPFLTRMVS